MHTDRSPCGSDYIGCLPIHTLLILLIELEWQKGGIMAFDSDYDKSGPKREEIDRLPGPVLLEFGTAWCGYCQAIQQPLKALLASFPQVHHIKVEDGKGRPLGRSFGVKLWPNFVFLRDGQIILQLARPQPGEIRQGLEAITRS
jgi:thioredoxin 1